MALEETGLRLVAEGASSYISDIGNADRATTGFVSGIEGGAPRVSGAGQIMIGALREIGAVAVTALGQAAQAAGAFAVDSVKAAGDFEAGTNRLASVAGDSLTQAGFSLDDVRQKALQLGADTAFSAQQAQDAMIELAKGGVPVQSVMTDATDATLALAAAGEVELGPAAEIVAKQLGVWAETGVSAADVSNLIAQAANASTVGVEDLALGLAQAGGQAKVSGVEFNDLVQTMALIAPNFSSASDAGTSLKTMLARLVPSTGPAAKAMSELGLMTFNTQKYMELLRERGVDPTGMSFDELHNKLYQVMSSMGELGEGSLSERSDQFRKMAGDLGLVHSAFFDMNGQLKSMADVSQILQDATKDLSEEEKSLALNTIFGTDAVRAASAIANAGAQGFSDMGVAMAGAGTAAEQATQRNQGFNFALEQMRGSVETLQIILGTALLPVLTTLLNTVITPGINTLMSFAQGLLGAADPVQYLVTAVNSVIPGFAAFAAMLMNAWTAAQPLVAIIGDNLMPILAGVAGVIGGVVVTAIGSAIAAFVSAAAPILALVAVGALLYEAWQTNFGGIRDIVTSILSAVWSYLSAIVGQIVQFWTAHSAEIVATGQQAWSQIETIVRTVGQIIATIVTTVFGGIATFLRTHSDDIQAVLTVAWTVIRTIVETTLTAISGIVQAALALIQGDWDGALNILKETGSTILESIKTNFSTMWDQIRDVVVERATQLKDWALDKIREIPGLITGLGATFASAGQGIVDNIKAGISAAWSGLVGWFQGKLQELRDQLPFSPPKDHTSPLTSLPAAGRGIIDQIQRGMEGVGLTIPVPSLTMPRIDMPGAAGRVAPITNIGGDTIHVDARGATSVADIRGAVETALSAQGRRADIRIRTA